MKRTLAAISLWALFTLSSIAGGFVNATDIGFSTDPNFDNTPAWNAMIVPGGPAAVYFEGPFYFKTQPDTITRVLRIEGNGTNGTTFYRDYVPVSSLAALIETTATLSMEKIGVLAAQGTDGVAVRLLGLWASASTLRDLYITAQTGASWGIPLVLWSDDPLGIRGVLLDNVELFAATIHGFWFVNVRGLTAGVQYYPAGGTVDWAVIQNNGTERAASIELNTRHLIKLWVYGTDNMTIKSVNGTDLVVSSDSTNINQLP